MSARGDFALNPWPKQPARDLTGERHGLVTVVRMAPSTGLGARCLVRCDCGKERYVLALSLRTAPPKTHRACNRKPEE